MAAAQLPRPAAIPRGGVSLPFAEAGDASGLPVVLLHGITDSGRSFEGVMRHLPSWTRAIAPTLRGHAGADQPAAGGYAPADFAADVVALMDALGIGRAVMVGHSMGATVAMRLAVDHPDRVRGLVLIDGFARFRGNPEIQALWDEVATLADPIDPAFARAFQEATVARPVAAGLIEMAVGESVQVPARVWRAALAGLIEDDVARDRHRIAAPTLLIWGERDAFVPRADQDALMAEIRGARRLVVHAGGGHAVHWEDPARVAGEIAAFAATTR
jgi:non-heme chloroperoxidase